MRAQKLLSVAALVVYLFSSLAVPASAKTAMLDTLTEGQLLHGFRTDAVYLDDADAPLGARFMHVRTGFTFDYLRLQSVPQAYLWVTTYPTSDKGEPHTQEHLLLGKGNKGRSVASLEDMSLVTSTAYTEQWRTVYQFHTGAGTDVFFKVFEAKLDALLHPDYTDEEIRREVRHFGAVEEPDGSLRIEEKGTVYNEMVSSFERPFTRLFRALGADVYGTSHPLAYVSGGSPAAIREMTPEDIRTFHREHYFLGNMGMIGSFPKEVALDDVLARAGAIFDRLEPEGTKPTARVVSHKDLPAPASAPAGHVRIVDYPGSNAQTPGPVIFYWPAQLETTPRERFLMNLFLANTAGDPTTNLYKLFIDTKTRQIDVGAKSVFAGSSSDQGTPVYVGLNDVAAEHLTAERLAAVRAAVQKEFARIASFADGSPELEEFNARVASRVVETRRGLSKFVNSPPGFGFRGSGSGWMEQLDELASAGGFRRSVTMKRDLEWVEGLLATRKNIWRDYVAAWKLVDSVPFAGAARANPSLIADDERERKARAAAEVARLKASYAVASDAEAIKRFRAEYDADTKELEALAKNTPTQRFLDAPPLTLDDQLDFRVATVAKAPLVASTFDNMTSATTGVALKLDGVAREDLVYLSLLPGLLTQVGVVENGTPVSYELMSERLRKEILSLNASFSTNARTGRAEVVVRGSGNTAEESERAIAWMRLVLSTPDWRAENLPRIRDVVDQTYGALRRTMRGPEEQWVNDPSRAWWRQNDELLLATNSFLTRTHFAFRLRWLLRDAGAPADREALTAFLDGLEKAGATAKRADLVALLAASQAPEALAKLPEGARANALEAVKDLEQTLPDVPDETLAADWAYVVRTLRTDLLANPADALAGLERVRREVARAGNARLFVIASRATQQRLEPRMEGLVGALAPGASTPARRTRERAIEARLASRANGARPVFVGLVNPNTRGGVFMNSAPAITYDSTDREALLRFMASKLYGGGGAHGIFMKTWGAGLAYSNGIGSSPSTGRINYYAERCPELPQTLGFVISELKRAPRDPALVEYAVAQSLAEFRSASSYEARGESMASDLADGITPDRVRAFRKAVLALRNDPALADALYDRMLGVYAQVLPGLNGQPAAVPDGVYYVVGPDKQMELYETYLKTSVSPDARLHRLYPRDYWLVRE